MRKKIIFICSAIGRAASGAIPLRTRFECEELYRRGHAVTALGARFDARVKVDTSFEVIEVKPSIPPYPLASIGLWLSYERRIYQCLCRLLRATHIDGIIETEQLMGRKLHDLCKRKGIPLVSFFHCDLISMNQQGISPHNWLVTRKVLANTFSAICSSHGIAVLNSGIRDRIAHRLNPRWQKIFVSSGTCDPLLLELPFSQAYRHPKTIFFAGRLSPEKGILVLIKAFAAMTEKEATLEIAGNGPLIPKIRKLITKYKLKDRVQLLGPLNQSLILSRMDKATITVVPSLSEQFCNVLIEAMSRGCPVIATDTDGPSEILMGGKYGVLVPPADINALAKNLDKLLKDSFIRNKYSQLGYQRAAHYRIDTVVPPVCDFYEEVFESHFN